MASPVRPRSPLTVDVVAAGPTALVRLDGELDLSTADELRRATEALPGDAREVQLDLAGLTFADSTGLARLLELSRRVHAEGAGMTTIAVSESVGALLRMTAIGLSLGWDDPLPAT